MSRKRISVEKMVENHRGHSADGSEALHQSENRREIESLLEAMNEVDLLVPPSLDPADREAVFQHAWAKSRQPNAAWLSGFRWTAWLRWNAFRIGLNPMRWKPAVSFAFGVLAGIVLTIATQSGQLDLAQPAAAEPDLKFEGMGTVESLRGKMVQNLYPHIERPVLVVEKDKNNPGKEKRVLYGTAQQGEVVVVWNL